MDDYEQAYLLRLYRLSTDYESRIECAVRPKYIARFRTFQALQARDFEHPLLPSANPPYHLQKKLAKYHHVP